MLGTYPMSHRLCMLLVVLGFEQTTLEKNSDLSNKIVRFIKNLGPRSHIGFLELNSLNMLNLDFRVKQLRLSHVHKIFNGTGLLYLSEQFIKVSDFIIITLEVVLKTL